MSLIELEEYVCVNCGGKIDRNTLRCLYCDTQYGRKHEGSQPVLMPVVGEYEGRGVKKLCVSIRADNRLFMDKDALEKRMEDMLAKQLAKSLRDYMRISITDDERSFSKIVSGLIMVVDPR